jgi:hypothetical protein
VFNSATIFWIALFALGISFENDAFEDFAIRPYPNKGAWMLLADAP